MRLARPPDSAHRMFYSINLAYFEKKLLSRDPCQIMFEQIRLGYMAQHYRNGFSIFGDSVPACNNLLVCQRPAVIRLSLAASVFQCLY